MSDKLYNVAEPTSLPDGTQESLSSPSPSESDTKKSFCLPKLRLHLQDLSHSASSTFLTSVPNPAALFSRSCANVLKHLYVSPTSHHFNVPGTRSVTLILREMDGVAYTTGIDLDDDHKEIHFSLNYIGGVDESRVAHEIEGVLTHELVHCLQYSNGCPGGLVEGVADWVRLQCDLAPPHWKRDIDGSWDRGYQNTAYFLEYLEGRFGVGTVRRINETLRLKKYEECTFWTELLGWPVEKLWEDYCKQFNDECSGKDEK